MILSNITCLKRGKAKEEPIFLILKNTKFCIIWLSTDYHFKHNGKATCIFQIKSV